MLKFILKNLTVWISSRAPKANRPRAAFTLIEMTVVIGVTLSIAGVLLVYGNSAKEQSVLSVQEAKIAQLIMRARSLAISTFNEVAPPPPCGYGVWIVSAREYRLFGTDYPGDPNKLARCRSLVTPLAPGSGGVIKTLEAHMLESSVNFRVTGTDRLRNVFFKPPDPTVLLIGTGSNPWKKIFLEGKSGGARTITVTNTGQISF